MAVAFVDGLGVKGRELKLTPGGHDRITFKLCAPFAPVSKPPQKIGIASVVSLASCTAPSYLDAE